jgi:uncharacterized protein
MPISPARAVAALVLTLTAPFGHAAPSFSCEAATKVSERLICTNETLSKLDQMLDEAYRAAMFSANPPARLQEDQRRWLNTRDACKTVRCLEAAYEKRIVELRRNSDCALQLGTSACFNGVSERLPRTADGRLMLRTRRECKMGFDGQDPRIFQAEAIQVQADCIEAGIYDPCEDASGTWGEAQCAYANTEVAERRIRKAQDQLRALSNGLSDERRIQQALQYAHKKWVSSRAATCEERNRRYLEAEAQEKATTGSADELVPKVDDAERVGFCFRRLADGRANELEEWVRVIGASNSRLERTRLFHDLLRDGVSRAAQPGR